VKTPARKSIITLSNNQEVELIVKNDFEKKDSTGSGAGSDIFYLFLNPEA
jgi:hypothetical protein